MDETDRLELSPEPATWLSDAAPLALCCTPDLDALVAPDGLTVLMLRCGTCGREFFEEDMPAIGAAQ